MALTIAPFWALLVASDVSSSEDRGGHNQWRLDVAGHVIELDLARDIERHLEPAHGMLPIVDAVNGRGGLRLQVIPELESFRLIDDSGATLEWSEAKVLLSERLSLTWNVLDSPLGNNSVDVIDAGEHMFYLPSALSAGPMGFLANLRLQSSDLRRKLFEAMWLEALASRELHESAQGSNARRVLDGSFVQASTRLSGLAGPGADLYEKFRAFQALGAASRHGQSISNVVDKVHDRTSGLRRSATIVGLVSTGLNFAADIEDETARNLFLGQVYREAMIQQRAEGLRQLLTSGGQGRADPAMLEGLQQAGRRMAALSEDKLRQMRDAVLAASGSAAAEALLGVVSSVALKHPGALVVKEVVDLAGESSGLYISNLTVGAYVTTSRFMLSRLTEMMETGQLGVVSADYLDVAGILQTFHTINYLALDELYNQLYEDRFTFGLSSIYKGAIFHLKDRFNPELRRTLTERRDRMQRIAERALAVDYQVEALLRELEPLYQGPNPSANHFVVAVIDGSGSMDNTDPRGLRREAVRFLADFLNEATALSVVEFDEKARTLTSLRGLGRWNSPERASVRQSASALTADGGTDIRSGLRAAVDLLQPHQQSRTIILISDGAHQASEPWAGEADFIPDDIVVHSLAFSDQADASSLSTLASQRNGVFQSVLRAEQLHPTITDLFGLAEQQELLLAHNGQIGQDEFIELTVSIEPGLQQILPQVSWPGSDIDLTMIDPHGQVLNLSQAVNAGLGRKSDTYNLMRIDAPRAGKWTMQLEGVDAEEGAIDYEARVATRRSGLSAQWRLEPGRPVRGREVQIGIETDVPVDWESVDTAIHLPGGETVRDRSTLGSAVRMLSAGGPLPVHQFVPDKAGVHRLTIDLSGTDPDGHRVNRFFDRSIEVFEPAGEDPAESQVLPFIRR